MKQTIHSCSYCVMSFPESAEGKKQTKRAASVQTLMELNKNLREPHQGGFRLLTAGSLR